MIFLFECEYSANWRQNTLRFSPSFCSTSENTFQKLSPRVQGVIGHLGYQSSAPKPSVRAYGSNKYEPFLARSSPHERWYGNSISQGRSRLNQFGRWPEA